MPNLMHFSTPDEAPKDSLVPLFTSPASPVTAAGESSEQVEWLGSSTLKGGCPFTPGQLDFLVDLLEMYREKNPDLDGFSLRFLSELEDKLDRMYD